MVCALKSKVLSLVHQKYSSLAHTCTLITHTHTPTPSPTHMYNTHPYIPTHTHAHPHLHMCTLTHTHTHIYTLSQAPPVPSRMVSDRVLTTISSQSKHSSKWRKMESFWSQESMRITIMVPQNPLATLPPALASQRTQDLQRHLATAKRGFSPQTRCLHPPSLREPLATLLGQQEEV